MQQTRAFAAFLENGKRKRLKSQISTRASQYRTPTTGVRFREKYFKVTDRNFLLVFKNVPWLEERGCGEGTSLSAHAQ